MASSPLQDGSVAADSDATGAAYHSEALRLATLSNSAIQQSVAVIERLTAECDEANRGRRAAEEQLAGSKQRAEKLFGEKRVALEQLQSLRQQQAAAAGKTTAVLKQVATSNPESDIAATIQQAEVETLIDLVEDEEEALELCKEVGLSLEGGLPMPTIKAALRGHYNPDLTVEAVFAETDVDGSGYLDEEEVQAAVAMLGYTMDSENLGTVMGEMDVDGNGQVTLEEFQGWWTSSFDAGTSQAAATPVPGGGGGGGGGDDGQLVATLRAQVAELQTELQAIRDSSELRGAKGRLRKVRAQGVEGEQPTVDIEEEEARELIELLDDAEEAEQLCRESGLSVDSSAKIETMKAALRGHFARRELSMEEVFHELDADHSGALDAGEVQQAVAMLGFLVDDGNLSSIMSQVTLQEFSDWWDVHVKGHGAEGGGGDGADPEELATLRAEAAAAKQEAAECGAQVESLRERAEQAEADAGQAGERLQSETAAAAEAVAAAKQAVAAAKQAEAAVMERAVKAEAELETARASGPPRPSAGDEEASTGLQDTVELLERLLRARDEEVTDQTAKLQSFASETQKLLHELEVANTKMSKMATQYQQLEQELEESDARLETVTGKNVELLERMAALRLAEGDRV